MLYLKIGGRCDPNKNDMDSLPDSGIRAEILAILNELRYITRKMKDDAKSSKETNDWKWAAMVIDRLCLWVFTAYLTIGTLVIFFNAPHLT